MDSLCVLAMEANNLQPSWLDLLNNNHRDSVVVSVFDTFKNAVRYEKNMVEAMLSSSIFL